jgi:hypothetical protein
MDISKNWSLKLSDVNLASATITPLSWRAEHRGEIGVDMRTIDGERLMFTIEPARIDVKAAISVFGKLKLAQFDISKAAINPVLGQAPMITNIGGAHGDLRARGSNAVLTINAQDVVLGGNNLGPLGNVLGATLSEASMVMTIDNWPVLQTGVAGAWQQAGGRLISDDWAVRWGKIDFVGDFNLGLKDGMPDGIVHVRIKDVSGLIASLIDNGLIDAAYRSQAQMMAASLAPGKDGRSSLEFTIRNGVLKYGFIELHKFQ